MSDIREFKCPACGGPMEFDSSLQKMKCPYCDTVAEIDAFADEETTEQQNTERQGAGQDPDGTDYWSEEETRGFHLYSCKSCGGEIIADETTGASACPYCGNQIVMKGQFAGALKPQFIIPFKKNKEDAKKAYKEFLKGKSFLPRMFKDQNHIDEIKGIYVPFWLFDANVEADLVYDAEKISTVTKRGKNADTEYTTTHYYRLYRSGRMDFHMVPADASTKMADALMDSVEPFRYQEAVPFKQAYLAGYMAERYDVDARKSLARAESRMKQSSRTAFAATASDFTSKRIVQENMGLQNVRHTYALLPVWLLNTTWNGQHFYFAMNGQTGKMIGDLPVSRGEFWKYVLTRGLIAGTVLCAALLAFFR